MAFNALGAVERKFECAKFCGSSMFYTFSNVSMGPPHQNCSEGLQEYVDDNFPIWSVEALIFSGMMLCGIIGTIAKIKRDSKKYAKFKDEKKDGKHQHHADNKKNAQVTVKVGR